jgi:hypothetical protein
MREDVTAYEGWKHLFVAIVADCQRVASGTNWDTWIKVGGPERIWQEGAWLWNQRGSRSWTWEDWERFQSRSDVLFDIGVRYCGLDEHFKPDAKVENVWIDVWRQAIADSVGIPDDLGYFMGDSHVWAIQFEGMLPVDRKNLIERGWESCRRNVRLVGLTADEVWQYEGLFHREYTGHNVGMGYMNLLALHAALKEEEIERFQDKIQIEKDFGQQTETLLAVKRKTDEIIRGGQYRKETPEPDSESGRSQCEAKEGGRFHALKIQKEERGVQLEREFWEFVEVSGLKFWGNLSSQQCERVLFQYEIPDLESMTPALLECCLGFWSPDGCGDWLSKVWFSGCCVLDTIKGNGGDFERSKRYPMYVEDLLGGYFLHCETEEEEEWEEPEEPQVATGGLRPVSMLPNFEREKENENIKNRLTITWAFVFDWWDKAVRAEENVVKEVGETERTEEQESKSEDSRPVRPKPGARLKPEQISFIQGAGDSETKERIAERFYEKYKFKITTRTVQKWRNKDNNSS